MVAGEGGELFVLGFAQDGGGFRLVQYIEARRHARFERKALQQRLAKGMDGEDVDAPRGVEDTGEQAAGRDALFPLGRPVDQSCDLAVECGLIGHRPAPELA